MSCSSSAQAVGAIATDGGALLEIMLHKMVLSSGQMVDEWHAWAVPVRRPLSGSCMLGYARGFDTASSFIPKITSQSTEQVHWIVHEAHVAKACSFVGLDNGHSILTALENVESYGGGGVAPRQH